MKLKVAAIDYRPLFSLRRNADGSSDPVGGWEYEFLKILSKALDFEYEVVSPQSGYWGFEGKDGNWTGMFGMLQRKEADLIIENVYISEEGRKIADFSFPYKMDRLTYGVNVAEEISKTFVYFFPFDFAIWIMILLSILMCCVLVFLCQRGIVSDCWQRNMMSSIEVAIGSKSLPLMQNQNRVYLFKLFISIYHIFMDILLYSYKGIFLSFLMAPVMKHQIDSLQDLAAASEGGTVKVTAGMAFVDQFLSYQDGTMISITKYLREHPNDFDSSDEDAVQLISKGYAVVDSELSLKLQQQESGIMNAFHISSDNVRLCPIAMAFSKTFCCKKKFDKLIQRVLQSGIYDKVVGDYLFSLQIKSQKSEIKEKLRQLGIADVHGALWIVLPCYLLSISAFILEYCTSFTQNQRRYKRRRKAWKPSKRKSKDRTSDEHYHHFGVDCRK